MATNNSSNNQFTNNSDGFVLGGGTTERKLTVTGGDVTLTGSGSNTYIMPAFGGTFISRDSTDTLTNKDLTDTSNSVSVQTLTNPYSFFYYRNSTASFSANTVALLKFDTKVEDTGSNYDTSTGLFTAPIAGIYRFYGQAIFSGAARVYCALYKNSTSVEYIRGLDNGGSVESPSSIAIPPMPLSSGDTIAFYFFSSVSGSLLVGGSPIFTYFGGELRSKT